MEAVGIARQPDVTTTIAVNNTIEIPAFIGPSGRSIFVCLHVPAGRSPRGLGIICSSLGAEWKHNYRREVILARALAARGIAAVRFHYLGTGQSDAGPTTFAQMVDDAHRAEAFAHSYAGDAFVALVGARLGAIVAATAGAGGCRPLVAWNAPLDVPRYFEDVFRASRAARLIRGFASAARYDAESALALSASAEALGYDLPSELVSSFRDQSLEKELLTRPRDVLLIEPVSSRDREVAEARAQHLTDVGCHVAVAHMDSELTWLEHADGRPEELRASTQRVVRGTVAWILRTQRTTRFLHSSIIERG